MQNQLNFNAVNANRALAYSFADAVPRFLPKFRGFTRASRGLREGFARVLTSTLANVRFPSCGGSNSTAASR